MRRGVGDRRLKPRFEIVGDLAGTLEAVVPLALRDAGQGGVLADSPLPLPIGSEHHLRLLADGMHATAQGIVRHVRSVTVSTGEERYLIGFEFAGENASMKEVVERWMLLYGEAAS